MIGKAREGLFTRPFLSNLFHSIPGRPISSSSIRFPARSSSIKPQKPLFLRPPIHLTTLKDLRKWHNWAKTLASSVGSTFSDADDGPDAALLHRELNWLVEDALENPKTLLTAQLGNINNEMEVKMKAGLEDLYMLWKQRIEERRPFQYVVGCEHWRDLVLSVEEGVLIPRPETELIVDLVGEKIKGNGELGEGMWADLGTGSGAIAIGIGRILGDSGRVVATDLSPVAVAVASYNVLRYDLQGKIAIKLGSWFEPLEDIKGELVGLVSNPPYIPSEHISVLQAEVAKHEPKLALDGGANGMDDLLHLCRGAASMLKAGGFFAFEGKIAIKLGSWFEPLEDIKGELVGLVSNPPYIPSEHISVLQAEVAKHEPKLALDGGANGMDDLLHLCRGAASMLKAGGFFAFETNGEKHCQFLANYFQDECEGSFCKVDIISDFAGKQRFVTGFRA